MSDIDKVADSIDRIGIKVSEIHDELYEGRKGRPPILMRLERIERNGHSTRGKMENAPTVLATPPSPASAGMPSGARSTALILALVGVITVLANALAKLIGV